MLTDHHIEIRVRYQETDGQGRVHHANYLTYFEMGRVELMRASGQSYRDLEESGVLLVVAEAECQYRGAAFYDDLLRLRTRTVSAKGARIEHHYEIRRGEELIVSGRTVIACVNRAGKVQRLPDWLQLKPAQEA